MFYDIIITDMLIIKDYYIVVSLVLFLMEVLLIKKLKTFDLDHCNEQITDFNHNLIETLHVLDEGHYLAYAFFYFLFLFMALYIDFIFILLISLQGFSVVMEIHLLNQLNKNHK